MQKFDDKITDLCADIDAWRGRTTGTTAAALLAEADELLHRARHLLKELLAEWPQRRDLPG